jgi:type II secretory pathway pseudopilin PulG
MRPRGYALVEVVIGVAILVLLMGLGSGLFQWLVLDVPRQRSAAESNNTLGRMIESLRADVAAGSSLAAPSDGVLLVQLPDGLVSYEAREGEIIKYRIAPGSREQARSWPAPGAVVRFEPLEAPARGVAVHTSVRLKEARRSREVLPNCHLLMLGRPQP